MKLGIAIRAQSGLAFAYRLKLKDGLRAFKLRKEIEKIQAEIATFDKLKEDSIKATGKQEIKPSDPEFSELVRILDEAAGADIADPTPYIEEGDLTGTEASAEEIDGIIALKLLKETSEAPTAPALPGPTIAK